jgi:penicillin-binding protein 1A
MDDVGIENSYTFLTEKLKFKHLVNADKNAASLALGGCTYGITPIESASAFAIFGNGGIYYKPTTYYKIVGVSGEVILEEDTKGERAISESTATIMNHLLREVVYAEGGTGRLIGGFNWRMKAYAKTGTSSDTKDSWLVGGTPYYVGSVWYGFDHNQRVYNTSAAKTVWRDIMREIHKDLEPIEFKDSEDVYRKGNGYYKVGTTPGIVLKEEDYLPQEELEDNSSEEATSSDTSSVTSSEPTESLPLEPNESETQSGDNSSEESPSSSTDSTPSEDTSSDIPSSEPTDTSQGSTSSEDSTPSQDTTIE